MFLIPSLGHELTKLDVRRVRVDVEEGEVKIEKWIGGELP